MWKRDDCCDYLHSERSQGEVIKVQWGNLFKKKKKLVAGARRLKILLHPIILCSPKWQQRALVRIQHTSPQGGAAAYTLQSPVTESRVNITKIKVAGVCYRVYLAEREYACQK